MIRSFAALAAAITLLCRAPVVVAQTPSPAPAAGPSNDALTQAKAHFAQGKALFDKGDKAAAVEEFKEAYKLSRNPLLLYNIGVTYDDLKDARLALYYFEKFLADAPNDDRTKANRATAETRVKALTAEVAKLDAQSAVTPTDGASSQPASQPTGGSAKGVTAFTHTPLDSVPPGKPVDVTVRVPDDAKWTVTLFYRPAGQESFKTAKLKVRYTEMVARIPEGDVRGANFQYYLVAQDEAGRDVGGSGKAGSPNIVYIEAGAKPHFYQDLEGSLDGEDSSGSGVVLGPRVPETKGRKYLRWGTTGAAAALLGTSLFLFLKASSASSTLEDEADASYGDGRPCADGDAPPCTTFSDYQKGVQSDGKAFEKWSNLTLYAGLAVGVGAGVLWYLDTRRPVRPAGEATASSKDDDSTNLVTVPVVGDDYVGGAALIQF